MTRKTLSLLPGILTGLLLAQASTSAEEKTLIVAPYLSEAPNGVLCLMVADEEGDPYAPLPAPIEGFSYEWGYTYEITIEERTVEAAAPYALIELVEKNPAPPGTVFEITLTGANITDEGDGLYRFHEQHAFSCPNPDVHAYLAELIGTDERIPFKLRLPDRDGRPLGLVSFRLPGATAGTAPEGPTEAIESDADPFIEGGRTLVPLRAIFEWLGADVTYSSETKRIAATRDDDRVEIEIGKTVGRVAGEAVTLDAPPVIEGGRTFVPMRFVAEALGAKVDWDGEAREVIVEDGGRIGTLRVP